MIRILVTLDCNVCGHPFDRIGISTSVDPLEWKSLSLDLEYQAQSTGGWFFFRAAHHCDYCASDPDYAALAHNAYKNNPFCPVRLKKN